MTELPILPPVAMIRVSQNPMRVDPNIREYYKTLLMDANKAYDLGDIQRGKDLETTARNLETWNPTQLSKNKPSVYDGAWWMTDEDISSLFDSDPPPQTATPLSQSTTPLKAFSNTTPPPMPYDSPPPHRRARSPSPHRRARSRSPYRRARSPSPHRRTRSRSPYRRARSRSPHRRARSRSIEKNWYPAPLQYDDRTGLYIPRTFKMPISVVEEFQNGSRKRYKTYTQVVNDLQTVHEVVSRLLKQLQITDYILIRVTRPHNVNLSDSIAKAVKYCEQKREPTLCVFVC